MNVYSILPLVSFLANAILGLYILYRDPKGKLNILYSLIAFSVACWSLGDFLVFTAENPAAAIYWEKLSTLGSAFVPPMLIHFSLVFTKSKIASRKILYLLYVPALLFIYVNFTTNLISGSVELKYWGYWITGGPLYTAFVSYIISYVFACTLIFYRFYFKTRGSKESIQAKLLTISIAVPLVGGTVTEIIPLTLGLENMPLTSTLTAITAFMIAYTMMRYRLMAPISFSIKRKMVLSFLVVATLMGIIGYSGIYALNQFDMSTSKILEEREPLLMRIGIMKSDLLVCRLKLDQYIVTGNKAHLQNLINHLNNVDEGVVFLEGQPLGDYEKGILDKFISAFDSYKKLVESMVSFYEKSPEDTETLSTKRNRIDSLLENALLIKLDSFYALERERIMQLGETSHNIYLQSFWSIIIFSIVIIIAGLLVSILISNSITAPLIKMAKIVPSIAKGEFGEKLDIRSKDEIGELASAFNKMRTDLKKSQEKIRRHAEELEEKVKERTIDLDEKVKELTETKTAVLNMMEDMDEANKELVKTQEELKQSLKELKEMDVKKDQFISIAAHELKTPLTSIHGFSQLLQNRKVANNFTKRNKYLKIMVHETERLAKLVGDILDLSRIDLGTVKLTFDKIDVNSFMGDIKREMNVQIISKGLSSEYDIEKDLPEIVTDREKLTEIVINLINNSVKYTERGKITVKASMDKGRLHFVIEDTGIGISKENRKRVFDRFYQVDSSYTRKAGGTGLGLALCKEFVELLGGKIWIKSEVGKGSEFHFTLPLKGGRGNYVREEERIAKERLEKSGKVRRELKKTGFGKFGEK